ncbi:MAG: hypothetical protein H6509_06405 [Bryobacterales bacterium]|nr:hypothetical protein [Bryobacterales bacterium]
MQPLEQTRRPSVPFIAGLFLGAPFFEVVSLSWFGSAAAIPAGALILACTGWMLLRPLPTLDSPWLTMLWRVSMIAAIVLTLHGLMAYWGLAVRNWAELRPSHALLYALASWMPTNVISDCVSAAFAVWAVWGASRELGRVQAAVQVLSAVALMICVMVLLTYQRAMPRMILEAGDWTAWSLGDLSGPWLYLTAAALAARALCIEPAEGAVVGRWTTSLAIALAFSAAAILPKVWIADIHMSGGGGSFGAVDVFHLLGATGRGALGGAYSGSALLVALVSMSTAMVLVYLLRRLWTAPHPAAGAAALTGIAWLDWPLEPRTEILALHAVGLTLSALAGVTVARGTFAQGVAGWTERVGAGVGLALAVFAWSADERAFDFLPFAGGALATLAGLKAGRDRPLGRSPLCF